MEKDAKFASLIRMLLDASVGRPNDRAAIKDLLAPQTAETLAKVEVKVD